LTASLRSEFWKSWEQVAKPAPWRDVTTVIPSTTKIELYLQTTPVPGFQRYVSERHYGQVDSFIYPVRNERFYTAWGAKLDDVDDDQVGMLKQQPGFAAEKGKEFPGRMALKLLGQALGGTIALSTAPAGNTNAFDGLPFFTNRTLAAGGFGIGNNLISFTAASGDSKTYNLAALYFGNPVLRPLAWQNREGPAFHTNSGTPQMYESTFVKWWVDLRGAPLLTWFWNAVAVQITNTPTVAEMHAIYSAVIAAFRSFQMPRTTTAEDGEYVHEQTEFSAENLMYVGSSYLSEQLRQSLGEQWVPQNIGANTVATTNTWRASAKFMITRFLDNF
jgi:phage major head subunit gpT-like protein